VKLFNESPNDSPGDGTIHPIALEQLQRYAKIAGTWKVYEDRHIMRCEKCHQGVWSIYDAKGNRYRYTSEEILALLVAHIRQVHDD